MSRTNRMPVSLNGGGGLVASVAGPTSGRPAVEHGAVYSMVDSGVTCYDSVQTSEAWCVAACDVLYKLTKVVVLSVSV